MPYLLRPRLACHYCGQRKKGKEKDSQRFKCENCLAVNYLDEVYTHLSFFKLICLLIL